MFKMFIYGFLCGLIVCGIAWFMVGRNNTGEVRSLYARIDRDLKRVERTVSELRDNSSGFNGTITAVNESSISVAERSRTALEGINNINGELTSITDSVGDLERWNRQSVKRHRDLAEIAHHFRRLSEEIDKKE